MSEKSIQSDHEDSNFQIGFSDRLNALLDARGYSGNALERTRQLASELGIAPSHVNKIFHVKMASPLLLTRLARQLNTSTDYLLGLTDHFDGVVRPSQDKSFIAWLWHPLDGAAGDFDLPLPRHSRSPHALKGLWAAKQTITLGYICELVIYDAAAIDISNGEAYLMELDGVIQIRTAALL
jgi:transcriptional regulator with XRE-family HTH domain